MQPSPRKKGRGSRAFVAGGSKEASVALEERPEECGCHDMAIE
jgi:hypothetical protein